MRLIDADALKDGAYINKGNFNTVEGIREWIDNAPTVEPKTDILEQIIAEINTSNRGTCDYYIVDRIEEIINEYQKGGAE